MNQQRVARIGSFVEEFEPFAKSHPSDPGASRTERQSKLAVNSAHRFGNLARIMDEVQFRLAVAVPEISVMS